VAHAKEALGARAAGLAEEEGAKAEAAADGFLDDTHAFDCAVAAGGGLGMGEGGAEVFY
jgi:hypothetical protein